MSNYEEFESMITGNTYDEVSDWIRHKVIY